MSYAPGLHLLLTIHSANRDKLQDSSGWTQLIRSQVQEYNLALVGEVVHDFPTGGYTAVHCLTESHISIHTWPEYGLCTCDVFLSNFKNNNHPIVRSIGSAVVSYFGSDSVEIREVER